MKEKLLLLLMIICCSGYYFQTIKVKEKCSCSSILIPKHVRVPIYDKPKGKKVDYIMNDTLKEDYFTVIIKQQSDSFFFVSASTVQDTLERQGWIEMRHLGIYPNNYSEPVILYSLPNRSSKIKSTIIKPEYYPFGILNCKGKWLYVRYLDADKKLKEGWLEPGMQCANPYTTCN